MFDLYLVLMVKSVNINPVFLNCKTSLSTKSKNLFSS